jgi:hypothetical protein
MLEPIRIHWRPVLSLRRACPERASAGARNKAKDPVNAREEALDETMRSKSLIKLRDQSRSDLLWHLRTTFLLLRTTRSFAYAPVRHQPFGRPLRTGGSKNVMHAEGRPLSLRRDMEGEAV